MTRYRGDPCWITARRDGECSKCQGPVKKGERAFWYPKGRDLLCEACGEPASARFNEAAWDEENNRCM